MATISEARNNKAGQLLGARGNRTRQRLLDAAAKLLRTTSPIDLNAAAITREAGTSAATFYVYFDDIRELVLALLADAEPDPAAMFPRDDALLVPERYEADATTMIEAEFAAWDRHASVLLFRNLEADRGDTAFDAARNEWARPILERLVGAIEMARGLVDPATAYADAVVLLAAIERIAATSHRRPVHGPPAADLRAALVRQVLHALR